MNRIEDIKVIEFENDNEFVEWALCPSYEFIESGRGSTCFDVPYTDEYLEAVEDDWSFDILDRKSRIKKDGLMHRGVITKPVDNLIN